MTRPWLACALPLLLNLPAPAAPHAGLWVEPALTPAVPLTVLRGWLAGAGFEATELTSADLLAPARLDAAALPLLILPYAGRYPVAGRAALDAYLAAGGSYLAVGGPPFEEPLVEVGGALHSWLDAGDEALALAGDAAPPVAMKGPDDTLTLTGRGTAEQPFEVRVPELKGWAYQGVTLPALPASAGLLEFTARGDAATPWLAIELQERDGSRWKQVVRLGEGWQSYRLPTASFGPYASPARNGARDYLHPDQAKALYFGLTSTVATKGAHAFALRDLRFRHALVPPDRLPAELVPPAGRRRVARFLTEVPVLGATWPTPFEEAGVLTGAELRTAAGEALPGRYTAAVTAPPGSQPAGRLTTLFKDGPTDWRWTPWLTANGQPVAGYAAHATGRYAGSLQAAVGVRGNGPLPALDAPMAALLRRLATAPVAGGLTPRMATADGQVTLTLSQTLVGRAVPLTAEVPLTAGGRTTTRTITLAPRQAVRVDLPPQPVAAPGNGPLAAAAEVRAGGSAERFTWTFAPRDALRDLADFLAAEGADDGKFSGVAFIDHRGVRTLLGAYEIFGDPRYRETALRWGRAMMAEQRADGGYRMGYGITSRGEECYVADGGEIALGMARLVAYADPPERAKLLDSLRRYLAFRDSFRVAGGGIGVGWCLSDYGKRPIVPLEKPTKVFAPETNLYTIGCTLAAASAVARLSDDRALDRANQADADWLAARINALSGASAESYVWAHATTADPARRQRYAALLKAKLVTPVAARKPGWWTGSGGRNALDLDSLVYYHQRIDADPQALADLTAAAVAMFAKESPTSIYRLLGRHDLGHDPWLYLCFGGVGLADLAQPGVTLKGFERTATATSINR